MRVAVVGAGISGVVAAAHARRRGLEITVFERNNAAGGIWFEIPTYISIVYSMVRRLYDARIAADPTYPANKPSQADPSTKQGNETRKGASQYELDEVKKLQHAPPGSEVPIRCEPIAANRTKNRPCYEGLSNNVATRLLALTLNSWKPGTADFVNHAVLNEYIQETSHKTGVHERTLYNTRVERISKDGSIWRVHTSTISTAEGLEHLVERSWVESTSTKCTII